MKRALVVAVAWYLGAAGVAAGATPEPIGEAYGSGRVSVTFEPDPAGNSQLKLTLNNLTDEALVVAFPKGGTTFDAGMIGKITVTSEKESRVRLAAQGSASLSLPQGGELHLTEGKFTLRKNADGNLSVSVEGLTIKMSRPGEPGS